MRRWLAPLAVLCSLSAGHRVPPPVSRFCLVGERNTGLEWVLSLFELNAPGLPVTQPFWRHSELTPDLVHLLGNSETVR
jgi:hypothetical protein